MATLHVVIASTRPGRVGLTVGRWFHQLALDHGAFEVELVDLAQVNLPFMDEPNHPRLRRYTKQHTLDWSAKVSEADAFAFVMPEYNHGFNAPLKNALDYLHHEWAYKPAALVSYGGVSAGTRAAQMIRQVFASLKLFPPGEAVSIPFVAKLIDDEGRLQPNEVMESSARAVLNELAALEAALRPLRKGDAPPA